MEMEKELEKLKKHLPKGFTRTLAKEFGVTDVTISHALSGKHRRFDIIQRAVEMARETAKTRRELNDVIEDLSK
jgi:predicted transcriptional regulator